MQERVAERKDETPADKAARITATATKWMAVFTFVLVLCTGATVVILRLQLKEMHEGGTDTHELAVQAKGQATAASQAARDADESLKRNTEAFKLDEQARLKIIVMATGWNPRMPRTPLVASYRYLNVGKTPAEIIGIDKHVSVIPFRPNVDNLSFTPTLPVPNPGKRELLPTDERLISAIDYSVPTSLQPSVQRGERVIVSWECVEYKDIFGEVHWADFCSVRQPAPNDQAYGECSYQCDRRRPN